MGIICIFVFLFHSDPPPYSVSLLTLYWIMFILFICCFLLVFCCALLFHSNVLLCFLLTYYSHQGPCRGFQDVLHIYKEVTPRVHMSGPTNFAPLIKQAIEIVKSSKSVSADFPWKGLKVMIENLFQAKNIHLYNSL